jgi:signal transduction histidine kinase
MEGGFAIERSWLRVPALLRERREARRAAERWWPLWREQTLATVVVDRRGVVVGWNGAAEQLLGWSRAEVLERASPVGQLRPGTQSLMRRDGVAVSVVAHTQPLRGARDEIVGQVSVLVEGGQRWQQAAAHTLADVLDPMAMLLRLAQLAVPELGDVCLVERWVPERQALERVVVEVADPRLRALAQALERATPVLAIRQAADGAPPTLLGDDLIRQLVDDPDAAQALAQASPRSAIVVPLRARGRTLGVMTLIRVERAHRSDDLEAVIELAAHASLAADNARLYVEAQEKVRERDEDLATASHDLKNPLLAVRMEAERILRLPNDEPTRVAAGRIARLAQQMSGLVAQLLDFALLEGRRARFTFAPADPSVLLEEALDVFRPVADAEGVTLTVVAAPGCGPIADDVRVRCDRPRIWQVLTNLVGNALKHGQGDEVTLWATHEADEVVFAVADNGRGLRESHAGSTGLGLAICRRILEAHGGRLWTDSEAGRGTTFFFSLPTSS